MKALAGVFLDSNSRFTLQRQISSQLKEHIQSGALKPGEALPSTRELATQLKVSRNTVVYAYDHLMSDGYLEPKSRSGIFVSTSLPSPQRRRARKADSVGGVAARTPTPETLGSPAPFRPCQPDVSLFPLFVWNRLRARALRTMGSSLLHYQASCNPGLPALRENLASYLRDHRGVRCDWRQIIITSGSQQGLYILANLLLGSNDHIYMEDPGYVEARLAWQHAGARVESAPIDDEGLQLPARAGRTFALIYTTPSRQFPTGVSLSLRRRFDLIHLAARTKAWVVEDDYDSELRYGAPPLPSLQSLDRNGRVIYVGTFSKLLFPSLRLGYVVVPEPLLDRFQWIKHLIDDHLPLIDQATLSLFLESGAFYSHIRRCRRAYAERQCLLLKLARESDLPLEFKYTDGGMNLTGFLPEGTDDKKWSALLRGAGFDVPSLSQYAFRRVRPGLVLGFTAFDTETIRAAFERMCKELRSLAS